MVRLLARAVRLRSRERRDAVHAAALLARATLALKLYPFSKAIVLGSVPMRKNDEDQGSVVRSSVRAVKRASYATPWRTVCIHEGLALQTMLRRRGVPAILCYGTRDAAGKLQSHVWVKVGDEIVIGGDEAPDFHLLATYPRAGRSSTNRPFSSLRT